MVARSVEYYLRTVARGRKEHYTGSGESAGTWLGEESRLLGLEGEVDPNSLRAVLAGASPEGEILVGSRLPDSRRICGFDLTFSAPESVSLLCGLSEPEVSGAVCVAHQEAIADVLEYLERHAWRLRRGTDGALHRVPRGGRRTSAPVAPVKQHSPAARSGMGTPG
jgi:conjugative relaxase-like TrwC/TraI family protein